MGDEKVGDILVFCLLVLVMLCDVSLFVEAFDVQW
ncbi:hypothetical protein Senen10_04503 [Salmonella enterica subsp. enterica]